MIHFDFTVEDVDAENIFDCINSEIRRCNRRKLSSDIKAEIEWFERHIEYLKTLKTKMKNTRAE